MLEPWLEAHPRTRAHALVPPDVASVLLVGCGAGDDALALAERIVGARVTGVDTSLARIDEALRRARHVALAVHFAVADARALPFDDERFDVVLADGVLGEVDDRLRAARELARVTRAGGRVLVHERADVISPRAPSSGDDHVATLLLRAGLGAVEIADEWTHHDGARGVTLIGLKPRDEVG
ncbi:class I SAM-dependent methyltransferase [Sandaracinus amylolyticus]|uniref:class I SAM-dependent methyltransferase n=1 Tax=Sandaracinus amylolyticus TaxID=927083 RepID=UPI001F4517E2|nr:class I SAM-dependent methyltransferase [Sandaracinus amylolyticus]UJR78712.1 SAM-dependent methyltransferase [Sandaracinus amylolyticus]